MKWEIAPKLREALTDGKNRAQFSQRLFGFKKLAR